MNCCPKRLHLLAIILVIIGWSAAYAQEQAALSDDEVKDRLSYIDTALRSAQPSARVWIYGWLAAYSTATVVQEGLAIAHWNDVKPADDSPDAPLVRDRAFAQDMLVSGATTALGVVGLLIDPFLPATSYNTLRSLPENTAEERRAKLDRAEEILRQCARRETDGRGLLTHALNLGVNAAAGLTTVLAFDRPWTDGLVTFAIGEAVSLLDIFTQPRRAVRDWQNYEAKFQKKDEASLPEARSKTQWSVSLFPGGVGLVLRF